MMCALSLCEFIGGCAPGPAGSAGRTRPVSVAHHPPVARARCSCAPTEEPPPHLHSVVAQVVRGAPGARRRGQGRRTGRSAGGRGVGALAGDLATGAREGALDDASEQEDDGHDQRGDAGDEEAVLDGGRAVLGTTTGDVADELEHDVPSLGNSVCSCEPRMFGSPEGNYVKTGQIRHQSSGLNEVIFLGGFVHSH